MLTALTTALAVLTGGPWGPAGVAAEPAPRQDEAPGPDDWQALDGIVMTVDDGYVTLSQFEERLRSLASSVAITTQEEVVELRRYVVRQMANELAYQSAGTGLEFSDIDLEQRLQDWLDERREDAGSVGFGAELRERGRDPLTELQRQRRELLGQLWLQRRIGEGSFGRPLVDTYVRPGTLRAEYPRFVRTLSSGDVVLRQVTVLGAQAGSPDAARAYLEELRAEVLAGEQDFAALAVELNADPELKDAEGLIGPLPEAQAAAGALGEFLGDAEVGAISDPYPIGPRGALAGPLTEPIGWALFRLERRTPGPAPPAFETAQAQGSIRRTIEETTRELRARRATDEVGRRVRRWLHPAFEPLLTGDGLGGGGR